MAGSMPLMWGPLGVPLAVVAVGVDTPLSLVGDIVTLPVVYARLRASQRAIALKLAQIRPVRALHFSETRFKARRDKGVGVGFGQALRKVFHGRGMGSS